MHIYLAFYVDTGKDYSRGIKSIENVLSKYFGGRCSLFTSERIRRVDAASNVAGVSEVLVYSIRKPVIKDPAHMSDFFSSLEHIFSVLSSHSPHFTQEHHYSVHGEGSVVAGGRG